MTETLHTWMLPPWISKCKKPIEVVEKAPVERMLDLLEEIADTGHADLPFDQIEGLLREYGRPS